MRAFYDSSVAVDPDEFEVFTGRILEGQTSIMRVTWSPRVTREERAEFGRGAREQGLKGYAIRDWALEGELSPAPERSDYFPVLYATHTPSFPSVLGVDLNSEAARREALQRAQDGDRIATAPKIELHHAARGDWRGFFVALPVYRRGLPHETLEERRAHTLGILAGTFQTAAVIDSILDAAQLPENIDLYLYAPDAKPDAAPDYMRASPLRDEPLQPKSQAALTSLPHWSGELTAGDARWTLDMAPSQGWLTNFHRAWIVLGFVILVFGAVLAYMWASARYALRLETANSKVLALAQTDLLTSLANRRDLLKAAHQSTRCEPAARRSRLCRALFRYRRLQGCERYARPSHGRRFAQGDRRPAETGRER